MGNFFSNLFDSDTPTTAPSASYTITPALSTETITTTTTSPATNKETSSSPEVCEDGSTPKVIKTTTTTTSNNAPQTTPSKQVQKSSDSEFMDFLHDIFNATTYTIIFWLISLYLVYKIVKSIFVNRGANNETSGVSSYSRTIDIALLILISIYAFQFYYYLPEENKKNMVGYIFNWTEQYLDNPWSLFELIWFTIIFFALVYILRVPMDPEVKPVLVDFVEHKIWIIYAIFAVIFFFKYALNIPIVTLLFNNSIVKYFQNVAPFSGTSQTLEDDLNNSQSANSTTDTVLVSSPSTQYTCEPDKQVFNVSNNLYNYEEAQKVCAAFDASLATYDQIETAYNNGAEWCNYGWSDGQMAYFPTQKETWENLQNNPNMKHACGRPGINGGFIDNPYIKFGANCFGVKAPEPDGWKAPVYGYAACQDNGENEELEKLRNSAKLNSFNIKKWSRY